MDSSTVHQASPLLFGFNFPQWCNRGKRKKKKEWLKGFWEFLSCLPPDIVFACTYQTLGEMETKTNTYSTHADVYTQTYSCTKQKEYPPRIIRSVMLSNSDPPTKLEHQ